MRRRFFKLIVLTCMLLGLPLLGVALTGYPTSRYLEFPPESRYVHHAPFSWPIFSGYTLFILVITLPLMVKAFRSFRTMKFKSYAVRPFPWWGWIGILTGVLSWILAWTRFPWFVRFQPHTFTPLWVSFILVVNALCHRQTGRCMMVERTRFFFLLFAVSAAFWWFFEYLNRFVQNWSYTGVHYGAPEYFFYATISYSTVLPAVLGVREWIYGFSWFRHGFGNFIPLKCANPKLLAMTVLMISGIGLTCMGIWPDYLFSLVWISPLLIIVSLQSLLGETNVLSEMADGNWSLMMSSASAAIFCGIFWEMWNYYSLARWEYSIPFVHRFKIFEMPVLGYAGYLPFGLECAVVGKLFERPIKIDKPAGNT